MHEFQEQQRRAGAVLCDRSTAPHARHFCCPNAEYIAARDDVAVFDLSDRVQLKLTGSARVKFLHSFCSNDIKSLADGRGCEAFVTNIKGRIVGHIFVFVMPDAIWIDSGPGTVETLSGHLGKYAIVEDVDISDESANRGDLLLSGENAATAIANFGVEADPFVIGQHVTHAWQGHAIDVRRTSMLGVPNFLLSVDRGGITQVWQHLIDAGVRPAGAEAFEALRIESLFPIHGQDISDENIAQEAARTELAISFTKGCYLGQEPIARLDSLGHVNKTLRGLRIDGDVKIDAGALIMPSDDDQEIGRVTSVAAIPGQAESVAMGFVRRRFMDAGTQVRVQTADGQSAASVFTLSSG
ncbi:MAG: hypothetical protein O3A00_01865 [Planctomycetota bacterium]|nr:hypothetical protein [Planctomycetota bacterium]